MIGLNDNEMRLLEDNERMETLLKAAYDILKQCDEGVYVKNALEVTAIWDNAECDGYCLMQEIKDELNLED